MSKLVFSDSRNINDARAVIQKAKQTTKTQPEFIVTDGLWSYEKAIGREFVTQRTRKNIVKHVRLESLRKKPNNNLIERYHGSFRERDKVMRGFKGGEAGISEGFRTYYNFIRPHMTLQMTPAQASSIDLQLGRNRWLSLLRRSLNQA